MTKQYLKSRWNFVLANKRLALAALLADISLITMVVAAINYLWC